MERALSDKGLVMMIWMASDKACNDDMDAKGPFLYYISLEGGEVVGQILTLVFLQYRRLNQLRGH